MSYDRRQQHPFWPIILLASVCLRWLSTRSILSSVLGVSTGLFSRAYDHVGARIMPRRIVYLPKRSLENFCEGEFSFFNDMKV